MIDVLCKYCINKVIKIINIYLINLISFINYAFIFDIEILITKEIEKNEIK